MSIDYLSVNGAIWDGCDVPPLRVVAKIYIRKVAYGGDIAEPIRCGCNQYCADSPVSELEAGV